MHRPKITVVIPMFNCAQYVENLFSMFKKQSLRDFEVLCVIDGATDNTKEVVTAFCESDKRFRYLVQENAGAGAARNTGLEHALGEYVVWADADDAYSSDYLKTMYKAGKKHRAEIVMCRFNTTDYLAQHSFQGGFNKKKKKKGNTYAHNEINISESLIASRVTNKMYKKEFILDKGIRFSESKVNEDVFFNYAALFSADRIVAVHEVLLEYRLNINPESITSKRNACLTVAANEFRKMYNWMKSQGLLDEHLADYLTIFSNSVSYSCSFEMDEASLQEITAVLNTEEPWSAMTSGEIAAHAEQVIFAPAAKDRLERMDGDLSPSTKIIKRRAINQINAAACIRKMSLEQYGRDFDDPNSMPR